MYQYKIKNLIRVIDGDTIEADIDLGFNITLNQTIRLEGINAPETRTLNEEVKKYGVRAKEKLQEYLKGPGDLIVATQKPNSTEKYGRVIGTIYKEGKDITANEYLLANNYVWVYGDKDLSKLEKL